MLRFTFLATTPGNSSSGSPSLVGGIGLVILILLAGFVGIILVITILRNARRQMNPPHRPENAPGQPIDAWTESGRRAAQADRRTPPPRPSIRKDDDDNSNDETDIDFEVPP